MDIELAVDIFDHDALTGGIVHDVMRLRGEAPSGEHNGGDNNVADVGPHLVDAGEVLEYYEPASHCAMVFPASTSARRACIPRTSGNRSSGGEPLSFTPSNSTGRPAPSRPTLAYFAFHLSHPCRRASCRCAHSRAGPS